MIAATGAIAIVATVAVGALKTGSNKPSGSKELAVAPETVSIEQSIPIEAGSETLKRSSPASGANEFPKQIRRRVQGTYKLTRSTQVYSEPSDTSRLIANIKNGTGTLADSVMEVDTATYNDPVLYEKEMRAIFDTLPFIAGMSSDLAKPGDFININEFGTPILITRNKDGAVKAFVNSCRHRGSALVFCARGQSPGGFSCPYHGWSYNLDGKLLGVAHPADFGEVDKSQLGLIEIMAEERHGIIFVATRPGVTFDRVGRTTRIAGVPADLLSSDAAPDFDTVLADSRMVKAGCVLF